MRNVLFVHNGPLYRAPDGRLFGTHYTEAVKKRYLLLGDHVTFLMREAPVEGPLDGYSLITEDRFTFVPVPNLMSPTGSFLNHSSVQRSIKSAVHDADIVVARIPSLTARLAVERAREMDKPCLIECVACNWDALWNHSWRGRLSAPWFYLMQKRALRQSTHSVYVTEDFLQRRYPSEGKQVAISDVELRATPRAVLERRIDRIHANASEGTSIRLVTVANVGVRYKAQEDVLAGLPLLGRRGIRAEYHLVGDGDQSHLRSIAQDFGVDEQVVFHGAMRHEQVFDLLDTMDIYVQPSRQEGLPRALIEAMSRGLPAAGARTGGIPEVLPPSRVFEAGRREEIASMVAGLVDSDVQESDARRNFLRAQDFRAETLDARRRSFYRTFLKDHGLLDDAAVKRLAAIGATP